jgi:hypothetical protein
MKNALADFLQAKTGTPTGRFFGLIPEGEQAALFGRTFGGGLFQIDGLARCASFLDVRGVQTEIDLPASRTAGMGGVFEVEGCSDNPRALCGVLGAFRRFFG